MSRRPPASASSAKNAGGDGCSLVADSNDHGSFPSIGDVLPTAYKRPYYETAKQAERRRRTSGDVESVHVVLGLEIDLLQRVADALGTGKLTLLIPVPVKNQDTPSNEVYVNKPVAVCSAVNKGDVNGVGVVMPLKPMNGNEHYEKMRQVVCGAEKQVKRKGSSQPRSAPPPKGSPS